MTERRYATFAEFWPFYLREHSRRGTRLLHYIGTTLVVLLGVTALATRELLLLLALPLPGYFFAWIAHFGHEKNRPATFAYPLWSLRADFRMWWLWLTRRLRPELEAAGVAPR
ncbi:DUF962 domain-containing protein [Qipengyuania sp. GPGPB31]|uniref:DUF962 domain-containing protein n=1 Tax=Qipengyuania sp. GPGPB31 TaxID=3023518 RepID=UPI0031343F05